MYIPPSNPYPFERVLANLITRLTLFLLLSQTDKAMMMHCNIHRDNPARHSTYTTWSNVTFINQPIIIVQNFLYSVPNHGVFGVLIPLLVAVLQVHVQGTNKSSFETHPMNMWIFLVATVVYYSAFAAEMKFKAHCTDNYSQLFNAIGIVSGSLSSVALVSALFPPSRGYIVFTAWAFVNVLLVIYKNATTIKAYYDWLCKKISANRSRLMEQPPLLPQLSL